MGAAPRIRANQRQLDLDLNKYLSQLNTIPDETTLGKLQDVLETLLSERSHPMIVALTSQREHLSRVRDLIGHELELRQTKKRAIKVEGDEAFSKRRRRNLNDDFDSATETSESQQNPNTSVTSDSSQSSAEVDLSTANTDSALVGGAKTKNHDAALNTEAPESSTPNNATPSSSNPANSAPPNTSRTNSTEFGNENSCSTAIDAGKANIKDELTDNPSTSGKTEVLAAKNRATAKPIRKNVSDKTLSQNEVIPNNTKYVTNPKSEFVSTQSLPAHTFYVFQEGDEKNEDEEAYKRRLGVVSYPKEDLSTLTAGPVPMDDFTRAKPSNQVQFNTYAAFLEPYFRPFTEEDLQFLQQPRSGNVSEAINLKTGRKLSPYIIPPLGPHYLHNWAIQDAELIGAEVNLAARKANETHISELTKLYDAAGSISEITDQSLEGSSLSLGPLTERLLAALVPESTDSKEIAGTGGTSSPNATIKAETNPSAISPSTTSTTIDKATNPLSSATSTADPSRAGSVVDSSLNDQSTSNSNTPNISRTTSVAPGSNSAPNTEASDLTSLPEGPLATILKNAPPSSVITDFEELENQIRNEFQRVGVLDPNRLHDFDQFKADFRLVVTHPRDELADLDQPAIDWINGAEDDEICRELRFLQSKLKQVSARNAIYKERLQPVVQEQLSWQEYQSILQDLDKQVDQAYQKRQKMPSSKQKKKKSTSVDSPHDSNAGTPLGGGPYTPDYTKYIMDVRPTIKALIDKRERWIGRIGPLFRPAHEMMREYEILKFDDIESQALATHSTSNDSSAM